MIIIDKREENRKKKEEINRIGATNRIKRRKTSFQDKMKQVPASPLLDGSLVEKYEIIKEISQRSKKCFFLAFFQKSLKLNFYSNFYFRCGCPK